MVVILAFLAALAATPAAARLARRTNILDHPGDLKVHTRAVPYLGGVGVAAGVAVGVAPAHPGLLIPLGLALAVGVVDDARHVNPAIRLIAEVAVGLTAAAVLPVRMPGVLGVLAVTVAVVVLINGVNMIDGLDALASGVALVSAVGFALILTGDGRTVALALAGALAGFLVFNRPPARIYLGDGGAYMVGAALALLLSLTWAQNRPMSLSLGALPLVGCPAAELCFAVVRRMRARTGLFAGDRGHIYDQLVDAGWTRNRTVGAYIAVQAVLVAAAVVAVRVPPPAAIAIVGGSTLALLSVVATFGLLTPTPPEAAT